jgi:hypothetical protein
MQPSATLEAESTLTDRFQTTVPEPVRRVLRLGKRDRIRYLVMPDGSVTLQRAAQNPDPVVGAFLEFLARDMRNRPDQLRALNPALRTRLNDIVGHIDVDLDEALTPDDDT